ncbi:MAG: hypothetical protein ABSE82_07400 [Nitrososphaerales archaeon]|jgi:NADH:ubiquinone oxidoreductase subunit D
MNSEQKIKISQLEYDIDKAERYLSHDQRDLDRILGHIIHMRQNIADNEKLSNKMTMEMAESIKIIEKMIADLKKLKAEAGE